MSTLIPALQRTDARLRKAAFLLSSRWEVRRRGTPDAWRILFSPKPGWEDALRKGFAGSPHTLSFAPLEGQALADADLVVPLDIEPLLGLRRQPQALWADNPLPLPSAESVLLCDDKQHFYRHLEQAGFTHAMPRIAEAGVLALPFIVKRRHDVMGQHCHVVRDETDLRRYAPLFADPDYFCQALVRGEEEFATHLLFRGGRIEHALNIRYRFTGDTPVKGKTPASWAPVAARHLALFGDMLSALGFEGLCCVNYKEEGGAPKVFEINPRFGGSLCPYFFTFVRHLQG